MTTVEQTTNKLAMNRTKKGECYSHWLVRDATNLIATFKFILNYTPEKKIVPVA
ncbi:MAG: hypothetical protein IGS23_18970 [Rivularia sp. T60_A2020_040]|nr:hypothetical protein [Rivularia sp. T60_A2020_040]